jgi:hypothetical protein
VYLDGKPDQVVLQFDNLARRVLPRLVDMGSVDDTGCCHASTPGYVPPEVKRTATAGAAGAVSAFCTLPWSGYKARAGFRSPRRDLECRGSSPWTPRLANGAPHLLHTLPCAAVHHCWESHSTPLPSPSIGACQKHYLGGNAAATPKWDAYAVAVIFGEVRGSHGLEGQRHADRGMPLSDSLVQPLSPVLGSPQKCNRVTHPRGLPAVALPRSPIISIPILKAQHAA